MLRYRSWRTAFSFAVQSSSPSLGSSPKGHLLSLDNPVTDRHLLFLFLQFFWLSFFPLKSIWAECREESYERPCHCIAHEEDISSGCVLYLHFPLQRKLANVLLIYPYPAFLSPHTGTRACSALPVAKGECYSHALNCSSAW